MPATVDTLWRAPLKGARGHRVQHLLVDPIVGVWDDRRFAVRRRAGDMTTWVPKAAFHVGMNTPEMAAEEPIQNGDGIDRQYLAALGTRIGAKDGFALHEADQSYSLHDTKGAFVSLINLASLQALSQFMGVDIDPTRFRMNVWITGLQAFEELTWVDTFPGTREITIGTCRFRVDDACERCKATEANPSTGRYDLEVREALRALMSSRGYTSPQRGTPVVMGILVAPLARGTLHRGDVIMLA